MLVAVDVGNSHTVIAVFRGDQPVVSWRTLSREATPDELAMTLSQLLAHRGLSLGSVEGLVVGSVVPTLRGAWRDAAAAYLRCRTLAVPSGAATALRLEVDRPGEVGADRIADCLAAWRLYGAPVIVVDCGTATTVDAVGAGGRYLGGAIAPGVGVAYEGLVARAALLQRVELTQPARALGTTTGDQIRSGVFYGAGGQVDALVERVREEMGGAERVVATGGWAATVTGASRLITDHDPWLTLHGLRLIFEGDGRPATDPTPATRAAG